MNCIDKDTINKAKKFEEISELLLSVVPPCSKTGKQCDDEIIKWIKTVRNFTTLELPGIVATIGQLDNKLSKIQNKIFKNKCGCS